mmetsp:Transcript_6317/g.9539  ORF Transcript_6317/g.9539 Transcript_6317/m.9539 type:complete len:204 (-) Transcript_6317:30-641(-)
MSKSIVPRGFERTAHSMFFEYLNPLREVDVDHMTVLGKNDELTIPSTVDDFKCAICLSSHVNPVTLVTCRHSYCQECVMIWFRRKAVCPLCKCDGNYFIQTDKYSEVGDVRIFSICPKISPIPRRIVEGAIRIHKARFLHKAPTYLKKSVKISIGDSGGRVMRCSKRKRIDEVLSTKIVQTDQELADAMQSLSEIDNAIRKLL